MAQTHWPDHGLKSLYWALLQQLFLIIVCIDHGTNSLSDHDLIMVHGALIMTPRACHDSYPNSLYWTLPEYGQNTLSCACLDQGPNSLSWSLANSVSWACPDHGPQKIVLIMSPIAFYDHGPTACPVDGFNILSWSWLQYYVPSLSWSWLQLPTVCLELVLIITPTACPWL